MELIESFSWNNKKYQYWKCTSIIDRIRFGKTRIEIINGRESEFLNYKNEEANDMWQLFRNGYSCVNYYENRRHDIEIAKMLECEEAKSWYSMLKGFMFCDSDIFDRNIDNNIWLMPKVENNIDITISFNTPDLEDISICALPKEIIEVLDDDMECFSITVFADYKAECEIMFCSDKNAKTIEITQPDFMVVNVAQFYMLYVGKIMTAAGEIKRSDF